MWLLVRRDPAAATSHNALLANSPPSACSGPCRYTAALVHQQRMDILLGACWQPAPEGEFPDRPQSPRAGGGAAAADGSAGTPPPARAAGYVPPHQRGQGELEEYSEWRKSLQCLRQRMAAAKGSSLLV